MERDELRESLGRRPNAVRFAELQQLLSLDGWTLIRVHGSHHIFAKGSRVVSIPFRRPHVLAAYVRLALRATAPED